MYASLDRVDIVMQRDGRPEYWQTDHRTAEEIEQQPALSVLFALVRILNPRRGSEAGAPEPVIVYSAMHPPPAFLTDALRAAGALLTVGDELEPKPVPGPEEPVPEQREGVLGRAMRLLGVGGVAKREERGPATLDKVIQDAFSSLARAVAAEHGVPLTIEGLRTLESALAENPGDPDDDPAAYWSAVFKLGSFGGELIRASNGGRWVQVETGSLPFALSTRFRGGQATVNPLGKAVKFFADGEGESVAALVRVTQASP